MPRLIALTGYAGSGKSTVAHHLTQSHYFVRIRFAEPLKNMLKAMGLTHEQVDGEEKSVPSSLLGGRTPRYAMQTLGTEWGREIMNYDLWLNATEKLVNEALANGFSVVIDDCRFPNEAEWVRKAGGQLWFVARPHNVDTAAPHHISEAHVENLANSHTLHNTGTVAELKSKVDAMLKEVA